MDNRKLISTSGALFDLVITLVFGFFMTKILMPHVPAQTEKMKLLFGIFTAIPMTGTFWMAISCLRVTWVDQLRRKHKQDTHHQ